MMDPEEFDIIMQTSRCKNCKAVPEKPYEGTVIISKSGDLMSSSILCSNCAEEMCAGGGMADAPA